jgi:hypothetical protein
MNDMGILYGILDKAGEQRFQSRAAGFQTVSSPDEAGQGLYRGIMAALGYASNKHPMAELACRMPLRRLESMVMAETPDLECLAVYQAMLLGTAGLLPSQRVLQLAKVKNDSWVEGVERLWPAAGEAVTMSETDWHFFRVRPGNSPARRIAAMSHLLLRYKEKGLLPGLIDKIDEVPVDGNYRELEDALIIEARDARGRYPDSGMADSQNQTSLLGRSRAADIVINVLLPFAAAWGRINSRPGLAEKAVTMYHKYPPLATNTLERHMSCQLGIDGGLVKTARRQQGLLHIFKTWCSTGKCFDCPVKKAI